ncbi:sigma 54-interacting transcriptional regulator [Fusobacterium varium]|uniref:sigma 54-interacting transcriptional regulator n=1 Tax=Fusobacterium varium TaxID=856 RepID=UPI000E42A04B|nr:sigma 54-interacting transcriptional regulator [Fusobacterium varium]MCI6032057.1 sigma 54-interacting transcriptional regulator [Fusobacterium varium]RGJ27149.1 AAA family ATPase [Fusobacterium varium]
MKRICLLAPYKDFLEQEENDKFLVKKYANLTEALKVAKNFQNNDGEIIITRGGTAKIIRENTSLTVIEVEISSVEILKTLKKIVRTNIPLGIVGYKNAVYKCSYLANIVGFTETYEVIFDEEQNYDKYLNTLEELIYEKKVKTFIGDTVLLNTLEKKSYYIDFYLIKSEYSSVHKAFEEAKKMLEFKENEKMKNRYLTAILNNTDCGMIYTDYEGKIGHYNLMGNKLFNDKVYINNSIFDLIHEIDKNFIFKLKNEVKNILIDTKIEKVSMDITPVQQSENKNSFLFTFRRFKNIEESANSLRKSLVNLEFSAKHTWKDIVTCDKNFEEIKKIARHYAGTENTILITGESGTGKELFAQSIHNGSKRKNEPFVAFNCANISENLIESELFGYEEGAFTGARRRGKKGLFELAHKGTIFLDEISEIPYHLQNKFLRVLQEKCFRRVGGEETIYVDVRVVAATNKNLSLLCDEGKFRTDLFYRLNVLEIETIPLRKRKEDIFIIGKHILEKELLGLNLFEAERFTNILEKLSEYPFPGNVRELENIVKRVVVLKINLKLSDDKILSLLPLGKIEKKNEFLNMTLREIERKIITEVLEEEDNNKTKTAIRLGIDRGTLNRILKEK